MWKEFILIFGYLPSLWLFHFQHFPLHFQVLCNPQSHPDSLDQEALNFLLFKLNTSWRIHRVKRRVNNKSYLVQFYLSNVDSSLDSACHFPRPLPDPQPLITAIHTQFINQGFGKSLYLYFEFIPPETLLI